MKKIITLALALLPLAACEPATAKKTDPQPREELRIPASPDGAMPFQLTDDAESIVYQPQLLIWDPAVTPAKIARVGKASIDGRSRKAERRLFADGELKPKTLLVEPLKQLVSELDVEIEKITAEQVKAALNEAFVNWFELRLAELGPTEGSGVLAAEDIDAARANFGGYCEYKIWELATSTLLRNQFATRPTPLVMCEPYYARDDVKLLDKTTEACADAPPGEFKDYFACIWEEGVFKTKHFLGKVEPAFCAGTRGIKRGETLRAWLADGTLRATLTNDTEISGRTVSATFTSAMLGHQAIPANIAVAPNAALSACRGAFVYRAPAAIATWADASLGQLKAMVETKQLTGTEAVTLLPRISDLALQQTKFEKLGTPLLLFGVRGEFSVNDTIFNQNYVGPIGVTVAPAVKTDFDNSQDFGVLGRAQEEAKKRLPLDLVVNRANAVTELATLEADLVTLKEKDAALVKAVGDNTLEGVDAVSGEATALMFLPFELRVTKNGAGLDVRLKLKTGKVGLVGCAPLLTGAPCEVRSAAFDKTARAFDALSYDPTHAELVLDIVLGDLEALGLGVAPRSGNPLFNDIPSSELTLRTLRLTIWPNRLAGTLNFITGKIEVLEAGEVKYLGSFSGDDFATRP